MIASAAWAVATLALVVAALQLSARILPSDRSHGERFLFALLVVFGAMITSMALLGQLGLLFGSIVLLMTLGIAGAVIRFERLDWIFGFHLPRLLWLPVGLSAVVVFFDVGTALPIPPSSWDAMTYHLYFPARWLQEGRIFHIPTVFSDNAAAFAPQNGALFFGWQMAIASRDAVVTVANFGGLLMLALALFRVCRISGGSTAGAWMASLLVCWLPPVRSASWSATVDLFMVACWMAAVAWQFSYFQRRQLPCLAATGFAAGLSLGSKTLALPLVGFSSIPLVASLIWQKGWKRLSLWIACLVVGGGWWYLLGWWRYGNPVFPLRVPIGGWTLPGAYETAAIRAGEFHLSSALEVAVNVLGQFGLGTVLVVVVGLVALLIAVLASPGRNRPMLAFATITSFGWLWYFSEVVPHNNQARFLLPVVVLSLVGWGWLLSRTRARLQLAVWLMAASAAGLGSAPWQFWLMNSATMEAAGVDLSRWLVVLAVASGAACAALWCRSIQGSWAGLIGWSLLLLAITLPVGVAGVVSGEIRSQVLSQADFRAWSPGYERFLQTSELPSTVAYAGSNVPYTLVGEGWQHRVLYINTNGSLEDGFFEFWDRDRQVYEYHKPGLYRGREDNPELWLRALDSSDVEFLVVFAMHRAERRYIASTADGFPIERYWAQTLPERFELVFEDAAAVIYRLNSAESAAASESSLSTSRTAPLE